jgi:hypothetical protein
VGIDERLLNGVLGASGADDARAVPQQWSAITVDDRREGGLLAADRQLGQPLVALQTQERRAGQARWVPQRVGLLRVRDRVLP